VKAKANKPNLENVSSSDSSFPSDEAEGNHIARLKHMLKPPKFDGQTSFETFWAQFTNCAEHSAWSESRRELYSSDVEKILGSGHFPETHTVKQHHLCNIPHTCATEQT